MTLLRRILIAEAHALWSGTPSPTRQIVAEVLTEHGLNLLTALVDVVRSDDVGRAFQDAQRDIAADIQVREVGPELAKCGAAIDDRSQTQVVAEWHGTMAAAKGPRCAKCDKRVDQVTFHMVEGTRPGWSSGVCYHCHGEHELVILAEDQPDALLGPWCRMQTVFAGGKPS